MTETELRRILRDELAPIRLDLEHLRQQVSNIQMELTVMRPNTDGIPTLQKAVTVLQQQVRAVRGAINDFAITNPTTGEIEALHEDVNKVQAEQRELAARLAGIERRLDTLGR